MWHLQYTDNRIFSYALEYPVLVPLKFEELMIEAVLSSSHEKTTVALPFGPSAAVSEQAVFPNL